MHHSTSTGGKARVELAGDTVFDGFINDTERQSAASRQLRGHILYGGEAARIVNLTNSGNAICVLSLIQVA